MYVGKCSIINMHLLVWVDLVGEVENPKVGKTKYGHGSTETEIQKWKYRSEKKSRLWVFSAL